MGFEDFFVAPHLANLAKSDENIDDSCQVDSTLKCRLISQGTQKTNRLGRILTGDLRRVKTEAFADKPLFLDRSEVFLDTFAGDTTTRNASAPSCTV
jgi:hypothetical protein